MSETLTFSAVTIPPDHISLVYAISLNAPLWTIAVEYGKLLLLPNKLTLSALSSKVTSSPTKNLNGESVNSIVLTPTEKSTHHVHVSQASLLGRYFTTACGASLYLTSTLTFVIATEALNLIALVCAVSVVV